MNIIKETENILKEGNIEEYKQEARILVMELSGLKLEDIILGKSITNKDKIISLAKKRIETKTPLHYLLGYKYFMGKKYKLNSSTLIPRDETEILVRHGYGILKNKKEKLDILDIGIGSGIISCSLAHLLEEKEIEILGVDINSDTLQTALENIDALDLIRKVIIRKSDIFSNIRENEKFDLIISNPPYIPLSEKKNLQEELSYEPESALFAKDEKGIEFYQKIIKKAPEHLKKEGFIAFELGFGQADDVQELLKENFHNIQIIPDLSGIKRVISAQIK